MTIILYNGKAFFFCWNCYYCQHKFWGYVVYLMILYWWYCDKLIYYIFIITKLAELLALGGHYGCASTFIYCTATSMIWVWYEHLLYSSYYQVNVHIWYSLLFLINEWLSYHLWHWWSVSNNKRISDKKTIQFVVCGK